MNNDEFLNYCVSGNIEMVKVGLQDPNVDPAYWENLPIQMAASNGHTEVIKILLQDKRVNPADDDNYAVQVAACYGHKECVKILMQDERVNPADDDNYAIRWAAYFGHTECVKLLLNDKRVSSREGLDELRQIYSDSFPQTTKEEIIAQLDSKEYFDFISSGKVPDRFVQHYNLFQ